MLAASLDNIAAGAVGRACPALVRFGWATTRQMLVRSADNNASM